MFESLLTVHQLACQDLALSLESSIWSRDDWTLVEKRYKEVRKEQREEEERRKKGARGEN